MSGRVNNPLVGGAQRLPCMTEGCISRNARTWVTKFSDAPNDVNGGSRAPGMISMHVCTNCRDFMITEGGWELSGGAWV